MAKKSTQGSKFVYVTYIRTTPEKLWGALTKPEFTQQYWFGSRHESDWKRGSTWKLKNADGSVWDSGEVLEADRPRLLKLKWRHEYMPEFKAEGYSQATLELEPNGEAVKLSITHEIDCADSKFIAAVSDGWPQIVSSLKSLLETGKPIQNE